MNSNTNNNLFPDYSEEDLNRYVFDGFIYLYEKVDSILEENGYVGIQDYRLIQESLLGTAWDEHIIQIRDTPSYKMAWHINDKEDGRGFTQKAKIFCNKFLIKETLKYKYFIGTNDEKKIRENACDRVSKDFPIELVQEIEDDFYVKECWNSRNAELRFLYMVPNMVYNLFSYLVNVNGIEWIEFILNDAKMDYIEVSRGWGKNDSDMLIYLDLCADKIKLMSDKMIPQKKTEYESNEELLRIFHGDESNMQKFLKNIQGLSGAAIVHRVKAAIEQNMIYADDAQTPMYNALKALGYPVTSLQNWNKAFCSKKRVSLIE